MTKRVLNNNFQSLEEMEWVMEKCVRCNMCKFPPLSRVEAIDYSIGCPSFDYFKFHASSGGGKLIMAASLTWGRSSVTESVKKFAYACTLCGSCDVSCKFCVDIELLDVLFMLRNRLFKEGALHERHRAILDCIRNYGHPLPELAKKSCRVPSDCQNDKADTLVWLGPRFPRDPTYAPWLEAMLEILKKGNIRYRILADEEPYSGRAALEIGDRDLFHEQSVKVAEAVQRAKPKKIVCLDAEDYSTLRSRTPRFVKFDTPVLHISEIYRQLVGKGSFAPRKAVSFQNVGWHDPSYLGRLAGKFVPWQGTNDKEELGIRAYVPTRTLDYGTGGAFDAPRTVLKRILGRPALELSLKKEYAYSCGETGQAKAILPEFVEATAQKRVQEALDHGIETLVTECPQAYRTLADASRNLSGIRIVSLTELMSKAYL